MSGNDKFFYIKLFAIFLAITLLLILSYTLKLREVIEHNIKLTVNEIALHDRGAINTFLNFVLEELSGVEKRLAANKDKNVRQLQSSLNLESSSTSFSHLYLLAEDGKVYSDKFTVYSSLPKILEGFANFRNPVHGIGKDRLILSFNEHSEFSAISPRGMILYCLRLYNAEFAGIKMSALIGVTDRDFLQRHLFLDSFISDGKARGQDALITRDGNYIFETKGQIIPGKENNFFAILSKSGASGMDKGQIQDKMSRNEQFSFYVDTNEGKKLFYMMPLADEAKHLPDWYFIMSLGSDVMAEQQSTYMLLGLALLGITILLLAAMMYYALHARHKLHKANEAVKIRSEFLSNMSHEIRTPLNGLIGLNYLISANLGDEKRLPKVKDWLVKSKSLADYLLSLLNDILDMSKLQSGKIDIVHEPYSVEKILDDIWYMQSGGMEKKRINFSIDKNIPFPWLIGDEIRIKQILNNIIGNAAKFTPKDGSVTIRASQKRIDSQRVVTTYICEDTGIGMSKGFLKTIFDPFSQEYNSNGDNTLKGTGLGMPICKELVTAMGGEIIVDSILGAGSSFTVSIPSMIGEPITWGEINRIQARAHENSSSSNSRQSMGTATDAGGKEKQIKILLAEDADFNAEFLVELLESEGFSVTHAQNGKMALEIFEKSNIGEYDIILMDMQMPLMDGCAAAAAIRKLERPDAREITIYACTANSFSEDLNRAMASGMDDFLIKPINIKVFLEKMKNGKKMARA